MGDTPLGPEDQTEPDRERQVRNPDGTAPADRAARKRPARSDADEAAWQAEATFDGEPTPPRLDDEREPDGVDPLVHRGE